MKVALVMGSLSDLPKVESIIDILKDFGVETAVRCLSAHRAHNKLIEFIEEVNNDGTEVIIAAAGMAAALPGVIASQTVLPVIGIPVSCKNTGGMDALLATVQMPSGIPVATVAIDGAANAAILAIQMLALSDAELYDKLVEARKKGTEKVLLKNKEIEEKFNK